MFLKRSIDLFRVKQTTRQFFIPLINSVLYITSRYAIPFSGTLSRF